jgi:multicomponent Na+:H+ antiporter subunit F
MTEFLLAAAAFVLGTVALGLVRILRGPGEADRMLAAQLLGTGGVAALLLFGVATRVSAIADIALVLALLAAFASVGFVAGSGGPNGGAAGTSGGGVDPPDRTGGDPR